MDSPHDEDYGYDHTEQQRFDVEQALASACAVGDRLQLMQRIINKHREISRLDQRIDEFRQERDQAQAEFNTLCAQSERLSAGQLS